MPKRSYSVLFKNKIKKFKKVTNVDPDKSVSIRSFLIGSISHGVSEVKNVLESEDLFSTIHCLKKLGVKIRKFGKKNYRIYGKGLGSLYAKKNSLLNCGNSGTCARLLIGILSTTPDIEVRIKGDKSLNKRNMLKLIKTMNEFGAEFYPKNKFNLPLKMTSSAIPTGIFYKAGVSSQLKSAAILASTNAYGQSTVIENKNLESRDHTENILLKNSNILKIRKEKNKSIMKISGKGHLECLKLSVFGDPSSAAFPAAITMLTPNSYLKIKNVGLNPKRTGFYRLMKMHGAKIIYKNVRKNNINELVGDICIKSSKLKPIRASAKIYPSMPDEYPILFIIAALTPGVHVFKGISDLSNKESSRAYEIKKILNQIGIKCKLNRDQMKIFGTKKIKRKLIKVSSLGDHRICMSSAVLSLVTSCPAHIRGFETVNTSSPSFLKTIKALGGKFEIKKAS
tara:strand:- start:2823 stop:4181 length:1359 start_codon:yes stop_codon:yes gene_type:complete